MLIEVIIVISVSLWDWVEMHSHLVTIHDMDLSFFRDKRKLNSINQVRIWKSCASKTRAFKSTMTQLIGIMILSVCAALTFRAECNLPGVCPLHCFIYRERAMSKQNTCLKGWCCATYNYNLRWFLAVLNRRCDLKEKMFPEAIICSYWSDLIWRIFQH